jgi:hypothetical protein
MDQIDRALSVAISVFKTLDLFVLPLKKSLESLFPKVDTKRRQKIWISSCRNKTRLVGIVSKKNRVKKGDPSVHLVRCLPKSPGKIMLKKKKMVDKRLSDWWVAHLEVFEEWPVGGCDGSGTEGSCLCVDD